ncbi:T9SS type A sorting domain-containing protein [Hyphobacterium sp. CCMP332]|nr:T9SS type A sorting domain-containing protein [Hyphobacterium sp. CCMP332]
MKITSLVLLILGFIVNALCAQSIVWERVISLPNDQSFVAIAEADSGFFGFGQGEDPTDFNECLKLDTAGNLIWRKPLGIGPTTSISGDMVKVPGEYAYYVSGFYSQGGFGNDFIAKVDTKGDTIWVYRYSSSGIYQTWYKLLALQDKSVLSIGYKSQSGTNEDIYIRRLDSTGNLIWENNYPVSGNQRALDITEMLDGSFIISGNSNGDNLIMKIGFDGTLKFDTIYAAPTQSTGFIRNFVSLFHGNDILLTSNFSSNGWLIGEYKYLNENINQISNTNTSDWLRSNFNVLADSTYLVSRSPSFDTMLISTFGLTRSLLQETIISIGSPRKIILNQYYANNAYYLSGIYLSGSDQDYYLSKLSGVTKEWIPDRCSYQPPIAGFEYEYNYPVLTLRDTSSGGLKYLDTVYTWQWTTSVGTNGTDDSLMVFFDTALSSSIDIELVIGNWYGCTDTVNQTLVLGETGLEVFRELEAKVFPNPVRDILNVYIEDVQDELVFNLYDLQGRLKFKKGLHQEESTISLSVLPQGLYIYDIRSERHVIPIASGRGKIIKE